MAAIKRSGEKHSIEWHVQRHPTCDLETLKAEMKAELKRELEKEQGRSR